jgi:hypothetical protein
LGRQCCAQVWEQNQLRQLCERTNFRLRPRKILRGCKLRRENLITPTSRSLSNYWPSAERFTAGWSGRSIPPLGLEVSALEEIRTHFPDSCDRRWSDGRCHESKRKPPLRFGCYQLGVSSSDGSFAARASLLRLSSHGPDTSTRCTSTRYQKNVETISSLVSTSPA